MDDLVYEAQHQYTLAQPEAGEAPRSDVNEIARAAPHGRAGGNESPPLFDRVDRGRCRAVPDGVSANITGNRPLVQ